MKSRVWMWVVAIALIAGVGVPMWLRAQVEEKTQAQRYSVTDLGTLSGVFAIGFGVNNRRLVNGLSALPAGQLRGFLWRDGVMSDLGTLGGPNGNASFPLNDRGEVAGLSDTSTLDPLGEDFCGFGTHLICLPFLWRDGVITPLPTLGGNNGQAFEINNRGQIAGEAENATYDATCVTPQVLQFKPVIWEKGEVQELPTLAGDPDGAAAAINDKGQVVGTSGNCQATPHPLLWNPRAEKESQNGGNSERFTVTNLGNLGGTGNNFAEDINNAGQVVGQSGVAGNTIVHAFLWTEESGIQDLGVLAGDTLSFGFGINQKSQVVGTSVDAKGNSRAFLRQSEVMTDLNTLIPASSPLFLFDAFAINDRGDIVGDALVISTGDVHAYMAIPCDAAQIDAEGCDAATPRGGASPQPRIALPENVRRLLRLRLGPRFRLPGP